MNKLHKIFFHGLLVMMVGIGVTHAENKVVVIPMAGENLINTGERQGDVLGYVVVRYSGGAPVIQESWMADGGTPTVVNQGVGRSDINWPGESFSILNQPAQATVYSASPMFIALDSTTKTVVHVWNKDGVNANPFGYSVTIYQDANPAN